ncbi:MAG TPA: hypothetical protein VF881_18610 [Polyangiaceae bacterium]
MATSRDLVVGMTSGRALTSARMGGDLPGSPLETPEVRTGE